MNCGLPCVYHVFVCMHACISIVGMTVFVYRVAWKWHTAACVEALPLPCSVCPHGLASAVYVRGKQLILTVFRGTGLKRLWNTTQINCLEKLQFKHLLVAWNNTVVSVWSQCIFCKYGPPYVRATKSHSLGLSLTPPAKISSSHSWFGKSQASVKQFCATAIAM